MTYVTFTLVGSTMMIVVLRRHALDGVRRGELEAGGEGGDGPGVGDRRCDCFGRAAAAAGSDCRWGDGGGADGGVFRCGGGVKGGGWGCACCGVRDGEIY